MENTTPSPKTQAVIDAYEASADRYKAFAAVIRAAVKQTRKRKVQKTIGITIAYGPTYCLEDDLLHLADELESL
jgi:hypothetical protein